MFTGFGEKGVPAEAVAERAAEGARVYLAASAPVDEHLADQLLLPMALGSGGSFIARTVTPHLHSNAVVIERFTGRKVAIAHGRRLRGSPRGLTIHPAERAHKIRGVR